MTLTFSPEFRERFDHVRALHPDCGFALYALEPRGLVTLEIITPEEPATVYTFVGRTAAEALDKAFPPEPPPAAEPAAKPASEPVPDKPSIFD